MKVKLYIVDDEPMAIKNFEYLLSSVNAECELVGAATNSKRALSEIARLQPDIIFTDISMPLMDGFSFAEAVQKVAVARIYLLTAYKDFDYIKRGMAIGVTDYILKNELNEDTLQQILDKAIAEVTEEKKQRHMLLEVNMRNFLMSNAEIPEHPFSHKTGLRRYSLIVLNSKNGVHIRYHPGKEAFLVDSYELQNLNWPQGVICKAFIKMLREEYCGIFQMEAFIEDSQKAVKDSVAVIYEYLKKCSMDATCFISDTVSDFSVMPNVYLESRQLATYYYAYPGEKIFMAQQLRENERRRSSSIVPWDEMMKCAETELTPENREPHVNRVAVLLQECRERQNLWEYEETLRSSFHILRSFIQKYQLDPTLLKEQERYEDAGEAEKAVLENLNRIYDAKEQADQNHFSSYVQSALYYIHNNYQKDISVPEIAEEIRVSEGHLRRCFKQELGVRLIDYMLDYRLKQAKRMIKEGEESLSTVWKSAGFSSAQYFSYVFKKNEGILPKDYVNQVRGN